VCLALFAFANFPLPNSIEFSVKSVFDIVGITSPLVLVLVLTSSYCNGSSVLNVFESTTKVSL